MSKKEEFLTEFKALLEKYNVDISFTVGPYSDTHGLHDEQMQICHTTPGTFICEVWKEVDGWGISKTDL